MADEELNDLQKRVGELEGEMSELGVKMDKLIKTGDKRLSVLTCVLISSLDDRGKYRPHLDSLLEDMDKETREMVEGILVRRSDS